MALNVNSRLANDFAWILFRCRQRFACALAFVLAMRLLNFVLLAPLAAGVLRLGLSRFGRASVGNFELLTFGLSPEGLVALLAMGTILLASTYLELAGLLRLLADDSLHWWEAFRSSPRAFFGLVRLGLVQLSMLLVIAIPFAASIALVYWWLWSGQDLNGLIILQPPQFWWGAGLASLLVVGFLACAALFFLRWLYAVPILCLEGVNSAREALRESARRAQDGSIYAVILLLFWGVGAFIVSYAALSATDYLSAEFLLLTSWNLATSIAATAFILVAGGLVAFLLSAQLNLTLAAAVLVLYRRTAGMASIHAPAEHSHQHLRLGWILGLALLLGVIISSLSSFLAIVSLDIDEPVEITAHRAGAAHAPENTLAALRQAIDDGADWAEIDVQNTADGQLVIMHDIDLARIGGGRKQVDQATLAEIQALDVGHLFSPDFAGEKVATLAEFLAVAKGKIKLNIELKPHGRNDAVVLTRRVVAAVQQADQLDRCRLCSQSYESLQLARELEPKLPVGYIAATTIGSPEKLNVDFLMVKSNLATSRLVDRARVRNVQIHAWTVNDPQLVAPLVDAGVSNLITDDPKLIRAQVAELRDLDTVERLLLRARSFILD
jgi:glycerophosphoryl diester phosphodiesterase